jgi:hypothetical protein
MNEPKPKRGGRRPNAGQPKKLGGYRRVNFSPSLPSIAIADRIKSEHGTTFTGAIELALKHYEETAKMNAKMSNNATEFFQQCSTMDVADLMQKLDNAGIPANQDWQNETPTWIFPDDSTIAISGREITVRAAAKTE